jgi:hypothetical protein
MARSKRIRFGVNLARGLIAVLGLGAVVWASSVAPFFWWEAPFTQATAQILAGDAFNTDALKELDARLEQSSLRSLVLDKLVIVRLRIVENSLSGAKEARDRSVSALDSSIRDALANAPADPFLWLILTWLDKVRGGASDVHFRDLEMSYLLGPNEGWIALKRNPFTLGFGSVLPNDLVERSAIEFAGLVRSGFYEEASQILIGPGWNLRETLLQRLRDVPEAARRDFAKNLSEKGVENATVPGIEPFNERPRFGG